MDRATLAAAISDIAEISEVSATATLDAALHTIQQQLAQGNTVQVAGLGTFSITRYSASNATRGGRRRHGATAARSTINFDPDPEFLTSPPSDWSTKSPTLRALYTSPEPSHTRLRRDVQGAPETDLLKHRSARDLDPARIGDEVFIPVHYATNRAPTGPSDASKAYSPERGYELLYGHLWISLPRQHKRGIIERPTIWRLWSEDPNRHIVVRRTAELARPEFLGSLQKELARIPEGMAFVFIHGFNVGFYAAARRAAQIAYDLFLVSEQDGVGCLSACPILFSWPSRGHPANYPHDAATVRASLTHLRSFLTDIARNSGASRITLLAHSMGSQVLLEALKDISLMLTDELLPFRQVILAAPDIDRDVFEQLAPHLGGSCVHATLYASDRDKAMKASRIFNGYPRAGDASGGVVIVEGIDSVDASEVGDDILSHSYGFRPDVLGDIHSIIMHEAPPSKRFGIVSIGTPPNRHWMLKAV